MHGSLSSGNPIIIGFLTNGTANRKSSTTTNAEIIRDLYAAAEARNLILDKFVSLFAEDGYFLDMASGQKWTGAEVRQPIEGLGSPFPDFHRELLQIHSNTDSLVVVELKLQGTHDVMV